MKLRNVGSNMNELSVDNVSILFSYDTPVAGWDGFGAFRVDRFYSVTTSRHVNKYLGDKKIGRPVTEEYVQSLISLKKV